MDKINHSDSETRQAPKIKKSPPKGIYAALNGAAAGLFSSIILQPLDVIKTNLIILPKNLEHIKDRNMFSSFSISSQYIYQNRGITGFWVGTIPAVGKGISSAATFFYFLPKIKNAFKEGMGMSENKSTFFGSGFARC